MLTRINYQSYDKFTDKSGYKYFSVRSDESESMSDPSPGDTVFIDQKEIRIRSISRSAI